METTQPHDWTQVKKIKFHHKVKRFYYKNLFRKVYTVVIIGLIAANIFSLLKYQSFAEEGDNRNTVTYSVDADGYTVTYDGKSYTVALSDLPGYYKWGNNTAGDSTYYYGTQYNNLWGGLGDNASNGFNPYPTNYDERKGPCDGGWHVPSRGEWNAIVIAWCHDANNSCAESDLQHASDWTADNGLITIKNNSMLNIEFKRDFGISNKNYYYWSSSPFTYINSSSHLLYLYDSYIDPFGSNADRRNSMRVRCLKNPAPSFSLTFVDKNDTSVELKSVDDIEENTTITLDMLPNVEDNHINLYYTEDGEKIDDILSVSISSDTIIYVDSIQYLSYNPDANITYTDTNGKVFEGIGTITLTDGENSITMLDRNLGATSTEIDDPYSFGYGFQWGNNYGFTRNTDGVEDVDYMVSGGEDDIYASDNWWNNPYVSSKLLSDWQGSEVLWGGEVDYERQGVDYERQGPCPAGYHVPSLEEWDDVFVMYSSLMNASGVITLNDDGSHNTNDHMLSSRFRTAFKLPKRRNGYESLWTSTPVARWIVVSDISVYMNYYGVGPSSSLSVRCFKDASSDDVLILEYDTDGGSAIQSQTIPDGQNAYLPGYTTHKDGAVFLGWYDDEGQKVILEMGDPSDNFEMSSSMADADGVVTVHAKWGYNVTFVDRDGAELKVEQVPEGQSVTAPEVPERDGYVFDGWDVDFSNVISDMTVTAQYKQTFTITWKDGDGNVLTTGSVAQGEMPSYAGATPTKTATSDYTYKFNGKWLPEIVAVNANAEYLAQFDATPINKGGNYSGGGGSKSSSKTSTKTDTHGSAEEQISPTPLCQEGQECGDNSSLIKEGDSEAVEDLKDFSADKSASEGQNGASLIKGGAESSEAEGFSQEFVKAYNFAKANGITTQSNIKNANMDGKLTRIQMAKMLSNYAINVLGQTPDTSKGVIKFKDVTNKMNKQYDNGVTLAYQLGIMGQNMKNNRFRPYDEVTRAEFTTALSRMIYGIKDGTGKTKYYEPHMNKLKKEGIITNTNPNIKELRGYVMLMLMRSAQK